MADLDIERIARALGDTLEDPVITKKEEGKQKVTLTTPEKEGAGVTKDSAGDGERPSFIPDLSGDVDRTPPKNTSQNSQIDTATAISAVGILKQELSKIDCTLQDYQIKFNLNGVDINKIKVAANNMDELRTKVPEAEGDDRHKFASKVASLALRAIQQPLNDRIKDELGLSTASFEYEESDQGALSMSVPSEEDNAPEEIAGLMEPELGDMGAPEAAPPMGGELGGEMGGEELTPNAMEPMAPEPMPGAAPEPMPAGPAPAAPAPGGAAPPPMI